MSDQTELRLLLLGATGQLGREIARVFSDTMEIESPGRDEIDLTRSASIRKYVKGFQPHWIINCAAYTAVDRAESDPTDAQLINADAVRVLGEEAKKVNAAIIHYSTDYVFDGNKTAPYLETDPTHPVNTYGRTKLNGELALEQSSAAYIVFRISWLYGERGNNFLRTILRLAHHSATSSMPVRIVNDQYGTPTWTHDVADATRIVVDRVSSEARAANSTVADAMLRYNGIYHLTGRGNTTWYGFAAEALVQLKMIMPGVNWARIVPISTSQYITPAKRPKNSNLDCTKVESVFKIKLPDWQDSLTSVLEMIAKEGVAGLG